MRILTAVAALALLAAPALAQTAAPANPLRPAAPAAAPAAPPAAAAPKAKRARSEAQLANDKRMKACGAEWRANKATLSKQGKTWRTYMPECTARLKAAGQ